MNNNDFVQVEREEFERMQAGSDLALLLTTSDYWNLLGPLLSAGTRTRPLPALAAARYIQLFEKKYAGMPEEYVAADAARAANAVTERLIIGGEILTSAIDTAEDLRKLGVLGTDEEMQDFINAAAEGHDFAPNLDLPEEG